MNKMTTTEKAGLLIFIVAVQRAFLGGGSAAIVYITFLFGAILFMFGEQIHNALKGDGEQQDDNDN